MVSDYSTSKLPPKVLELPGTTSRCSLVGGEQEDWRHLPGQHAQNKSWVSLQGPALLVLSQFGRAGAMGSPEAGGRGRWAGGKEPNRLFLILFITFD